MKSLIVCSVLGLLLGAVSHVQAKEAAAPAHASIVKKYSLEQMQEASNYLLARVENDPLGKGKKILSCDASVDEANRWSGGEMHSLMDEKGKERLAAYENSPETFKEKIAKCDRDCTCAPYALLFEQLSEPTRASEAHIVNAAALKDQLARGSKEKTLACAKKATWFCKSDLRRYLKAN